MTRPTLALLPFAFLFLKNAAAQDHFFSGNISHLASTNRLVNGTSQGGLGLIFPSVEKGWKYRQHAWLGIEAGLGFYGFWQQGFTQGSRQTSAEMGVFYRKDRQIVDKFNFFGKLRLKYLHSHSEYFQVSGVIFETKSRAVLLSANVGAEYFFKKNWAVTANLGGGSLGFSHEKNDSPDAPPVSNNFSLALDFTTLIYSAGLRYFW